MTPKKKGELDVLIPQKTLLKNGKNVFAFSLKEKPNQIDDILFITPNTKKKKLQDSKIFSINVPLSIFFPFHFLSQKLQIPKQKTKSKIRNCRITITQHNFTKVNPAFFFTHKCRRRHKFKIKITNLQRNKFLPSKKKSNYPLFTNLIHFTLQGQKHQKNTKTPNK